jgi:predicted dehydrogenase
MTGPLRVGIIGANPNHIWAKDSHIPALRSLEDVQLAAVATTSRASADAAAEAFGVGAAYDDPLALITASDIDLVSVCVRVPYHRDLVLAALAAESTFIASGRSDVTAPKPPRWPPPRGPTQSTWRSACRPT